VRSIAIDKGCGGSLPVVELLQAEKRPAYEGSKSPALEIESICGVPLRRHFLSNLAVLSVRCHRE
jgi:hypothetical protein